MSRKVRPSSKQSSQVQRGIREGYRSGLEEVTAEDLKAKGVSASFESMKIKYVKPAKDATYTPDFLLPNGIIVETKGRFVTADRLKHLLIKAQHGDKYDIRFVFGGSRKKPSDTPISKQSKTTYAMWCDKHGFPYADHRIPDNWLKEPKKHE